MTMGYDYTTTVSDERFSKRHIVRASSLSAKISKPVEENRTFVPFAGFNGQQLAGSGALVFEGELLGERLQ